MPTRVRGRRMHGEELKQTKLSEAQVLELRRDYPRNKDGCRFYAVKYGVSRTAIQMALDGRTWAWIPLNEADRRIGETPLTDAEFDTHNDGDS